MSAALDTLAALLAGRPGVAGALLPACRAHAFGAEAFGVAQICELFARHPRPLSAEPHVIETATGLAVFDADAQGREQALVADLYDGRIGRLWRVGPAADRDPLDPAAEPALAVAFDPFLSQHRAAVTFSAADVPQLDGGALPALSAVALTLAEALEGPEPRPLPARAFGADGRAAALFVVHVNAGEADRALRTVLAAAAIRHDAAGRLLHSRVIIDGASPAPPLARLVEA